MAGNERIALRGKPMILSPAADSGYCCKNRSPSAISSFNAWRMPCSACCSKSVRITQRPTRADAMRSQQQLGEKAGKVGFAFHIGAFNYPLLPLQRTHQRQRKAGCGVTHGERGGPSAGLRLDHLGASVADPSGQKIDFLLAKTDARHLG